MPVTHPQFVSYNGGLKQRPIYYGDQMLPTFNEVPQIDISDLYHDSIDVRRALAAKIGKAVQEVGFFYACKPPGISGELMDRVFAAAAQFYALPAEEKMKIHISKSPAGRGYEPHGETNTDKTSEGDVKESFGMGEDVCDPDQAWMGKARDPLDRPMNIWSDHESAVGFRKVMNEYYKATYNFGHQLLRIYSLALGLEEDALNYIFKDGPAVTTLALHYPPQSAAVGREAVGLGAHADYSLFTLLLQGGQNGLQVLNDNGHWVNAPPVKHSHLCNVGEFLTALTNGRFRSTVHRVINNYGTPRFSLPTFFAPNYFVTIAPLPEIMEKGEVVQYEPIDVEKSYVLSTWILRHQHPTAVYLREKKIPYKKLNFRVLQGYLDFDDQDEEGVEMN